MHHHYVALDGSAGCNLRVTLFFIIGVPLFMCASYRNTFLEPSRGVVFLVVITRHVHISRSI